MTPDPPIRAQAENVTMVGFLKTPGPVSGGILTLEITYFGIPVYSFESSICDIIQCPVQPGPLSAYVIIPGSAIPRISPPGTYVGTSRIVDNNQNELSCITLEFDLP